jgi:hypothetical protein
MGRGKYGKGARWRVEKRENFHGFSRFSTFYRPHQARNSAISALFRVGPSGAWNQCGKWGAGVFGYWAAQQVDLCGTKFGLFHESARSFTKVRTDQARKSAMFRIVTGGTNFLATDGTQIKHGY